MTAVAIGCVGISENVGYGVADGLGRVAASAPPLQATAPSIRERDAIASKYRGRICMPVLVDGNIGENNFDNREFDDTHAGLSSRVHHLRSQVDYLHLQEQVLSRGNQLTSRESPVFSGNGALEPLRTARYTVPTGGSLPYLPSNSATIGLSTIGRNTFFSV